MARESATEEVTEHLGEHPMAPIVWRHEPAAWTRYNPETVTPMFYVIDPLGQITVVERGAAAASVLEALVDSWNSGPADGSS